jgi:hypothetical protein
MTVQECASRLDTAKIVSSERENEQGNHTRRANQLPAPVAHRIEKAFFEDIARPQTFSPAPQIRTGYYSNQKISSMRVSIRYFCRDSSEQVVRTEVDTQVQDLCFTLRAVNHEQPIIFYFPSLQELACFENNL